MRILITNNTLAARAGAELYVRDVAISLQNRGHTPVAYSSKLGEVAEDLRKATIPVVDDLSKLPFKPDIIHGQHHLDTMAALLALPGVPAVYFCHGWMTWQAAPPVFPRILRYVAVDHTCLDRLLYDAMIAEDKIQVLLNFVDLKRFQPRAPLPAKPKRALIFSNYARQENYVNAVREACARFQIETDVLGSGTNTASSEPENILPNYDLVFAKARAALEAMAVGCAVVVCDSSGCGPLVTMENFDKLRPFNFGVRTLRNALTTDFVADQITKYDVENASKVCRKIRQEADLEHTTDALVRLYEEVICEFKKLPPPDLGKELAAAGAYMHSLSPLIKKLASPPPAPPPAPARKKRALPSRVWRAIRNRD